MDVSIVATASAGAENGARLLRRFLPAAPDAVMVMPFGAAMALVVPAVMAPVVVPAAVVMIAIVMPIVGQSGVQGRRCDDKAERSGKSLERTHGVPLLCYGHAAGGRATAALVPAARSAIFARRCRRAGAIGATHIVRLCGILRNVVARILGLVGGDRIQLIRLLGIDGLGRALPAARGQREQDGHEDQAAFHLFPLGSPARNAPAGRTGASAFATRQEKTHGTGETGSAAQGGRA